MVVTEDVAPPPVQTPRYLASGGSEHGPWAGVLQFGGVAVGGSALGGVLIGPIGAVVGGVALATLWTALSRRKRGHARDD